MKKATRFRVNPGWRILITDIGISPADVLTLAGLPTDIFSREEAWLSVNEYFNLWNALEQAAGSENLPLLVGKALSTEAFDPVLFACVCSPDLNTAVSRISRFKALLGPMNLHVAITRSTTTVSIDCKGYTEQIPEALGATEMVFFVQLARLATRNNIVPKQVCFAHYQDNSAYTNYFGTSVQTGPHYSVTFSAHDAMRPFLTDNAAMWKFFEPDLQLKLSALNTEASTVQRVKSALLELLPQGESSVDVAAKKLALSKRTLQRKLSAEKTTYQKVLNETREKLACHYLKNSTIPAGEISLLLGFQETNSFSRAFTSWTGKTPASFRQNT